MRRNWHFKNPELAEKFQKLSQEEQADITKTNKSIALVELITTLLSFAGELYAFFTFHESTLFVGMLGTSLTEDPGYILSTLGLVLLDLFLIWLIFFIIKKVITTFIKKNFVDKHSNLVAFIQ